MGVGAAACEPGTLSLIRQIYPERRSGPRARRLDGGLGHLARARARARRRARRWARAGGGSSGSTSRFGDLASLPRPSTLPESADPEGRSLDVPGLVAGAAAVIAVTFAVIEGENGGFGTWWIVAAVRRRGRRSPPRSSWSSARVPIRCCGSSSSATRPSRRERRRVRDSFGLFAVFFFTALYLQMVTNFSGWKIALEFAWRWRWRWSSPARSRAAGRRGRAAGADGGRLPARRARAASSSTGCSPRRRPSPALVGPLAVVGFGLGLALVAVTAAVLAIVPAERSGMAASTVNTSRELGGVLAVAILGAVVNAQLTTGLSEKLVKLGRSAAVSADRRPRRDHRREHEPFGLRDCEGAHDARRQGAPRRGGAAGHGVHLALRIAGGIVLAAAVVAALAARHRVARVGELEL